MLSLSFDQITTCKVLLQDYEKILLKYTSRRSENIDKYLKTLKHTLNKDTTQNIRGRLERQKRTFELTLLGLSTYSLRKLF